MSHATPYADGANAPATGESLDRRPMSKSSKSVKNAAAPAKVLLINMPWTDVTEPSLGLGILKSILTASNIECRVLEAQVYLLKWLQPPTYKNFSKRWVVNDWLFTRELLPEAYPESLDMGMLDEALSDDTFVRKTCVSNDELREKALRIRREVVPVYLDYLMGLVDFSEYALVGFTCLSDQTFAALALANRIRQKYPDILLAFGGYSLTPPTGPHLQRIFETMDVVAYGDGEVVIGPLYEAAMGIRSLDSVPNISYRTESGELAFTETVQCNLDDSPAPDYDEYFATWRFMKEHEQVSTKIQDIPFESSRGCWWGQKSHCTFCGIDKETLRYRVKKPDVANAQLDQLHEKYGITRFRASDYIFPYDYHGEFLDRCKKRPVPYQLHYEMKSGLTEKKALALKEAGLFFAQLGVESFWAFQ